MTSPHLLESPELVKSCYSQDTSEKLEVETKLNSYKESLSKIVSSGGNYSFNKQDNLVKVSFRLQTSNQIK